MRKFFLLITFVATYGVSRGQTVSVDDFDYFVGCFAVTDPLNKETVDCSRFIEWQFVRPDSDGYRRVQNKFESSRNRHWVYDWDPLSNQSKNPCGPRYRQSSNGFEFYILMDLFGHERQINVLTAWERVGRDSLRYHCGQVDGFDSSIGASRIERVITFPDSSTLLVVKSEGEGYRRYSFFRGSPNCDFVSFYKKHWGIPHDQSGGSYTNIHYNFEHLVSSAFKITEVSEFITVKYEDPFYLGYQISVDSANVRIIDLWEMAQKRFGIKSE